MHRVIPAAAALLAAAVVPAAAERLPASRASFSADAVVEIGGERLAYEVHHVAGLERQEMLVDGLLQVTILRPDLGRAFVIQPGLDDYLELPLEEAMLLPTRDDLQDYEVELLGPGRDGGEAVTRYRISGEDEGQALDLEAWVTDDGIVMRLEGEMVFDDTPEHVLMILRDVQRAPLDPALFNAEAARQALADDNAAEPPGGRESGTPP